MPGEPPHPTSSSRTEKLVQTVRLIVPPASPEPGDADRLEFSFSRPLRSFPGRPPRRPRRDRTMDGRKNAGDGGSEPCGRSGKTGRVSTRHCREYAFAQAALLTLHRSGGSKSHRSAIGESLPADPKGRKAGHVL